MRAALNGAQLVLTCQRSDCGEQEVVDLSAGSSSVPFWLEPDDVPEGWGWDTNGLEDVLHCPEHRS